VSEPLLDATIRPQVLFPAYLAGFNLAESFYLAMPFLSWQTIVIGDPLCAPFSRAVLAPDQIAKGTDPDTGLPAIFSERTVAILSAGGLKVDAVKMGLKGDAAARAHDMAAAEALWLRATDAEPRLLAIQTELAVLYENHEAWDKAIDRYRHILAVHDTDVVSLNNLAYALAVRSNAPKDALPFAQKAFRLSPTPVVADTLGWIDHLLGDEFAAQSLLERAAAGSPSTAEILFHSAVVHASLGQKAKAKQELDAAEKLDPQLSSRADAKALRALVGSNV
jgi:tetratricopeptide (TPR) repeat protein